MDEREPVERDALDEEVANAEVTLRFAPFCLDSANELLWCGKQRVPLKPKAFAVLRYLVQRPRRLITKEELLAALWPDVNVGDAVLKTQLKEIRSALRDDARAPKFIETAHRRGYRFIAAIEQPGQAVSASSVQPSQVALVGRDTELANLEATLAHAMHGSLQTVFITGEAGAGKTALANAFLARLRQRGDVWVAHGQCIQQYGAGEAYMPVMEAFARLARGSASHEVVGVLRKHAPSWLAHMPALLDAKEAERFQRTGAATPERMLREMADTIGAISERHPVVLVFEDLQWADHSTLNLISYLGRRPDPLRALLVGTYRSRDVPLMDHPLEAIQRDLEVNGRGQELCLEDLSEAAVAQYVAARFTPNELPASLFRLLRERTNGNPLFMVKLVDAWIERQLVVQDGGTWRLGAEIITLMRMVPGSVSRMIETEIERLPKAERDILEAASVAGLEFSVDVVATALGVDVIEVEQSCSGWARRGIFLKLVGERAWPDGSVALRCAFLHGLYQQVAYDRITVSRSVQLHRRIGERLETACGDQARRMSVELAMHFERAREYLRAARYLVVAGGLALRRSAYREAIDQFQHGLTLLGRLANGAESTIVELELQVGLGAALAMTRGYAALEVDRAFVRARHLCVELGDVVRLYPVVIEGIWKYYYSRGDCRTAGVIAAQCHALADEPSADIRLRREARLMLGVSCFYLGRLTESKMHLEAVLPLFETNPSGPDLPPYKEDSQVAAYAHLSWTSWLSGYPDLALLRAEQAVALARKLEHSFTLAFALYFLLVVRDFRRDHKIGLAVAGELVALATEQGFTFFAALGSMLRGWYIALYGEIERGLSSFEAGWAVYRAMGAATGGPFFRARLAEILARVGRLEEARSHLHDALEIAERNDDHGWDPELYRLQGELSGEGSEALLLRALEAARQWGARSLELRAAVSLARVLGARGHAVEAESLVRSILGTFDEGMDTVDLREAQQLLNLLK